MCIRDRHQNDNLEDLEDGMRIGNTSAKIAAGNMHDQRFNPIGTDQKNDCHNDGTDNIE